MRLFLAASLFLATGCKPTKCAIDGDCAEGDICVSSANVCRKACAAPFECRGSQVCAQAPDKRFACLEPGDVTKLPVGESTDTSLGNPCYSPNNDGRSQATGSLLACGENASLCTPIFGPQDTSPANDFTCTTECEIDADCAAEAVSTCTGACKAAYENLCCIPALRQTAVEQQTGAKKSSVNGQTLSLYCRPRTACYLVNKRCTQNSDCGANGSRAGSVCTTTADGGGACKGGKLAMYECCQRNGECDQDEANGGANGLICAESLDRLSGYCTRPCTSDAQCRPPAVPGASPNAACWTTTYALTDTSGQCRVVDTPTGQCRNQPKPVKPNPPTALVPCDFNDRPLSLPDNTYDDSTRRCVRTF